MLRTLLQDRFKLKFHEGAKEVSGLALVQGKGGAKLQPVKSGVPRTSVRSARGTGLMQLHAESVSMEMLAGFITTLGNGVTVNRTGLTGSYDFILEWTPGVGDLVKGSFVPWEGDPSGPSLATALQEQLG